MKKLNLCIGALAILASSAVHPAVINVATGTIEGIPGSELTGAYNVKINGSLYDVDFVDGTCVALFSGCDDVSDFTFQTFADADAASQALLDQVFGGAFSQEDYDANPESTENIGNELDGYILTPVIPTELDFIKYSAARNSKDETLDEVQRGEVGIQADLITYDPLHDSQTWAVWTPVPVPSILSLIGIGLAGLGFSCRSKLQA